MRTNQRYYLTSYKNPERSSNLFLRNSKKNNRILTLLKQQSNSLNKLTLYDPDEEYVTKLNFYNIDNPETQFGNGNENKMAFYNSNMLPQLTVIKRDKNNTESFNAKKKLLNELTSKKNIFDKKNGLGSSKDIYVNRLENSNEENKKEKERKDLENKIHKLKELIDSLSEELSSTISEIDSIKLEIDIIQNYRNSLDKSKHSGSNKENKENKFKNEMLLYSKSESARKIKEEKLEKIAALEEKRNELLNKINTCEIEKKKFKNLLFNVKNELLIHYHKLLSEGKDTRKEGLSWIIQAIWNLKSNVMLSYLPKYLDEDIITFLFKYSSKISNIKKLENNIKELTVKLKQTKDEFNIKMTTQKNKNQKISKNKNNNKNENKDSDYNYESPKKEKDDENTKNENFNDENTNNENFNGENTNNENFNEENNNNNDSIGNDKSESKKFKFKNNNEENNNEQNCKDSSDEANSLSNSIDSSKMKIRKIFKSDNNSNNNKTESEKNIKNLNSFKEFYESNKFQDTFKTSIYNNTKTENLPNHMVNFFQEENTKNAFLSFDKPKKKPQASNLRKMPKILLKNAFNKKEMLLKREFNRNEENKIKLKDFENYYNKNMDYVDPLTLELFNELKKMEKYCADLKSEADLMLREELNRVSRSFYLDDYGGKHEIDQKTVIGAIIGEDNVRNEYIREKKEEREYFKTLRELRNGKIFQK